MGAGRRQIESVALCVWQCHLRNVSTLSNRTIFVLSCEKTYLSRDGKWYNFGMKKVKLLFLGCFAASVLTALAFVNNLVAIARWWAAFRAAGGDSALVPAAAPGFIPWLDWSAVDYSAVTTLIPMLGFVSMTLALGRMLARRRMRTEDFPFFKGSDQLNIALGLFGTLWGIIVIGYFKLDTVSMADLMQCLHTALFSTLTAVVWVFMIDRPFVRPWFVRLLEAENLAETDESDLGRAVERLVVHLGEASDAFDRRQRAFDAAFEGRQSRFEKASEKRQAAFERAYAARQEAFASAFKSRLTEFADSFRRQQLSAAEAFALREEELSVAITRRVAENELAFKKRMEELDAFFVARMAKFDEEFARREREYAETLRRRIDELSASAAEARERAGEANERAARLDARLKAVTMALHD